MRTSIRAVSLVYRIIAIVAIASGVARITGVGTADVDAGVLLYYTSLSNLLGLAWMTVATVVTVRRIRRTGWRGDASVAPRLGAAVALALLVTALIYLVILAPTAFTQGSTYEPFTLTDNLVHIIGPALVMGDWLLFARRGALRWWDPVWWAAVPYAYVAFALLRPLFTEVLWSNGRRYPYPFFDPSGQGWGGVVVYLLVLTLAIEAIAFCMVALDRLVGRWAGRRGRPRTAPDVRGE